MILGLLSVILSSVLLLESVIFVAADESVDSSVMDVELVVLVVFTTVVSLWYVTINVPVAFTYWYAS